MCACWEFARKNNARDSFAFPDLHIKNLRGRFHLRKDCSLGLSTHPPTHPPSHPPRFIVSWVPHVSEFVGLPTSQFVGLPTSQFVGFPTSLSSWVPHVSVCWVPHVSVCWVPHVSTVVRFPTSELALVILCGWLGSNQLTNRVSAVVELTTS